MTLKNIYLLPAKTSLIAFGKRSAGFDHSHLVGRATTYDGNLTTTKSKAVVTDFMLSMPSYITR